MHIPIADITRFATTAAASLSVGKVLSEIIKNNVPAATTKLDTIQVKVGGAVLSFVIAGAATRRIEEIARDVAEQVAQRQALRTTVTD